MTQSELSIFAAKFTEALETQRKRLKSSPNETYRDELILTTAEAVGILLAELLEITIEVKNTSEAILRTEDEEKKED